MSKKNIVVELRGVEFVNKGAELMLMTILKLLRDRYGKEVTIVMERNKRVPISKLKENKIYVKFLFRRFGVKWEEVGKFFPSILKSFGFILPKDINVVLDGSGFAFGDQWGSRHAYYRLGKHLPFWKKNNVSVILLPQAFGPFTEVKLREDMKANIELCDLIFAREEQSYQYLKEICDSDKITLAPDFTNLIKGYVPSDFNAGENRVAIIPNYKMIEQRLTESEYLTFLTNVGNYLLKRQAKPFFLIHEGERDRGIAEKANSLLETPINIIQYGDPLAVKGIISACDFTICSRFHGVVSSLSQGVPCIATSWSHKYEMLMGEYDADFTIVKDFKSKQHVIEKIDFLLNFENREKISSILKTNGETQRGKSREAWDTIFKYIEN